MYAKENYDTTWNKECFSAHRLQRQALPLLTDIHIMLFARESVGSTDMMAGQRSAKGKEDEAAIRWIMQTACSLRD